MKKIICVLFVFYNLCSCLYGADVVNIASVANNFAEAILFPNDKTLCIVKPAIFLDETLSLKFKDGTTFNEFTLNNNVSKDAINSTTIAYTDLVICGKADSLILIRDEVFSNKPELYGPVFMKPGEIWLIILEPMFDENGKLKNISKLDKHRFDSFLGQPFIDKTSFFHVPHLSNEHVLKIGDIPQMNIPYSRALTPEIRNLVEDIQKLSSLFCGKKYELLDGIESINKSMPSLQSDFGKLIANKMIEILETKAIDAAKAAQNLQDTTKILK